MRHYVADNSQGYSYDQWVERRREWNKRWNITNVKRGSSLPTPPDLLGLQLWFEGKAFPRGYKPFSEEAGGEAYARRERVR